MAKAPAHDCPQEDSVPLAELKRLHRTQAGTEKGQRKARHRCVACAYQAGFLEGMLNAEKNRKKRSWTLEGNMQLCDEGNAAPERTLKSVPSTQKVVFRHKCVVCAWRLGWIAGVASVI